MFTISKKNNYLLISAVLPLLSACQTTLPVFEQQTESATSGVECPKVSTAIKNSQYDYLVYANKMIDSMVKNQNVQERLQHKRLSIYLQPVKNNTPDDIDISAVNYAIKNRVIRSGQFIITDQRERADYQISGSISPDKSIDDCDRGSRKFTLLLTGIKQPAVLWSEYKKLN